MKKRAGDATNADGPMPERRNLPSDDQRTKCHAHRRRRARALPRALSAPGGNGRPLCSDADHAPRARSADPSRPAPWCPAGGRIRPPRATRRRRRQRRHRPQAPLYAVRRARPRPPSRRARRAAAAPRGRSRLRARAGAPAQLRGVSRALRAPAEIARRVGGGRRVHRHARRQPEPLARLRRRRPVRRVDGPPQPKEPHHADPRADAARARARAAPTVRGRAPAAGAARATDVGERHARPPAGRRRSARRARAHQRDSAAPHLRDVARAPDRDHAGGREVDGPQVDVDARTHLRARPAAAARGADGGARFDGGRRRRAPPSAKGLAQASREPTTPAWCRR